MYEQQEDINVKVGRLEKQMEIDFFTLGEVLSDIKKGKKYRIKGYKTFREYIKCETKLPMSLVTNVLRVYKTYVHELGMAEADVKNIGYEKLIKIASLVSDAKQEDVDKYVEMATEKSVLEVEEAVKEEKDRIKAKKKPNLADVFTDQHVEKFTTEFPCNKKKLQYYTALYLHNVDVKQFKKVALEAHHQMEAELGLG